MVSTPKIIGLTSCGFLLCLGLSNGAGRQRGSGCRGEESWHTPCEAAGWSEGGRARGCSRIRDRL